MHLDNGPSPIRRNGPPVRQTVTFYAAATDGGAVEVLNTVDRINGHIESWEQDSPSVPGVPGEWQFNDPVNSSHLLTAGIM